MQLCRLLLLVAIPSIATAAEIPDLTIPNGIGVNIHFVGGHETDLDLIAAAGFKLVRMDFGWAGIERKKGEYDWSAYEELVANLDHRGIRALFILDYSNPLYEETVTSGNPINGEMHKTTASPQHDASVAAYARWAAAAVGHFRGRHIIWEIWNEPNIQFWSPKPDAQQYVNMARSACKAIRQADPAATVIGPATSGFPWEFLEECFKGGLLEYWDAVSVHPYRDYRHSPETVERDYLKLRELISQHAPAGKKSMPIVSGEWGYATHDKGVPLEKQAAFIARQQLFNLLQQIPVSIWYDWKNDGDDPKEREHNFGTVTPDLKPKPAWTAIQVLTSKLAGHRITHRVALDNVDDYLIVCAKPDGGQKLVAWTTGEPHIRRIPVVAKKGAAISGKKSNGEAFQVKLGAENMLELNLDPAPHYLDLGTAIVKVQ